MDAANEGATPEGTCPHIHLLLVNVSLVFPLFLSFYQRAWADEWKLRMETEWKPALPKEVNCRMLPPTTFGVCQCQCIPDHSLQVTNIEMNTRSMEYLDDGTQVRGSLFLSVVVGCIGFCVHVFYITTFTNVVSPGQAPLEPIFISTCIWTIQALNVTTSTSI